MCIEKYLENVVRVSENIDFSRNFSYANNLDIQTF